MDRLPNQVTTKTKESMTIDGVKLELYHFAPAHTSGDLVVHLAAQKIVSTGDVVTMNRADDNPNIHFEKNGSTEGWLANLKGMIALNADTYVTGNWLRPPSGETKLSRWQKKARRSSRSRLHCLTLRLPALRLAVLLRLRL